MRLSESETSESLAVTPPPGRLLRLCPHYVVSNGNLKEADRVHIRLCSNVVS